MGLEEVAHAGLGEVVEVVFFFVEVVLAFIEGASVVSFFFIGRAASSFVPSAFVFKEVLGVASLASAQTAPFSRHFLSPV